MENRFLKHFPGPTPHSDFDEAKIVVVVLFPLLTILFALSLYPACLITCTVVSQ